MLNFSVMNWARTAIACALLACSCSGSGESTASGQPVSNGGAAGATTGTQLDPSYTVPTAPDLGAAATFAVSHVDWQVSGNQATLSYDLPLELVGRVIRVDFTGPLAADGTAHLTGDAGTADCTVSATRVVCRENMPGLVPLEPNLAVVQSLAKASFNGNAQDRLTVATVFAADPIGVLSFDPTAEAGRAGHGADDGP